MANLEQASRYCTSCNRNVLATRKGTSHIFHLLMTVLTAGLWLFIWIPSTIKVGGWRCQFCGGTNLLGAK